MNNNNSTIVFGIKGTSQPRYTIDNLKWKFVHLYGSLPTNCAVKECGGAYEATAHVKFGDKRKTNEWSLVPMCSSHNNRYNNGVRVPLRKNAKTLLVSEVRKVTDEQANQAEEKYSQE
eukprot:c5994_g1_i1.p1 GENE.c5994_g1_i1~~c5994_g1_i1.p1  ORF type:complete len:118 (+),score=15.24 c5994_g1_i1:3-356(+)